MSRLNKTNLETENIKTPFSKGETVCLTYKIDGKPKYYITSTALRDVYYLYEVINNVAIKTKHKANNPTDLYKFIET